MADCAHLDQIRLTQPAGPVAGCQECLKTGGWWVHLRMCQTYQLQSSPGSTDRAMGWWS
jgi:hypothetical protein